VVRTVWVLEADRPALVLGSTQPDTVADRPALTAAGVELVRRRSGGGAVLLEGGADLWVDVFLPRSDPLWDDDVGRAAWWLGEVWAAALAGSGAVSRPCVHRGGLVRRPWSDLVCFAGLGAGEVTAGPGGPKVVGISQRRTRDGARFQCSLTSAWAPGNLARLLAVPVDQREKLVLDLRDAAVGVGDLAAVEAAFQARLP
jgi:lipoate---protein ligase